MKEILEIVLDNFWSFSGTLILIYSVGVALNFAFAGIRGKLIK